MRVLVRADASATVGAGHVARCLTLAGALRARGVVVELALARPSEATLAWVRGAGHVAHGLDVDRGSEEDAAATAALAAGDPVVVDSYAVTGPWLAGLRARGSFVAFVDDLAAFPLDVDAVLDPNFHAESLRYELAPHTRAWLGPRYALVRDEFRAARAARAPSRADAFEGRVVATFGGADPSGETERLLAGLLEVRLPLGVVVVVGAHNPRRTAVEEAARTIARSAPRHALEVRVDVTNLGALFADADLVVTAAGSTCQEIATVGVPGMAVATADNQRPVHDAVAAEGLLVGLGWHAELTPTDYARGLERLATDGAARRAMAERQRARVDGEGAGRAASALLDALGWLSGPGA